MSGTGSPEELPAPDADVTVETDIDTFFALAAASLAPRDAVEQGRVRLTGDVELLERCFQVFSITPRVPA